MTVEITVDLPDDLVALLDAQVAAGEARDRAHAVIVALGRARRHRAASADAVILRRDGGDRDMDALVAYAAEPPVDPD